MLESEIEGLGTLPIATDAEPKEERSRDQAPAIGWESGEIR